ncbi:CocE/NonD family hydrolase [Candidatus Latescibacterota bacterium]
MRRVTVLVLLCVVVFSQALTAEELSQPIYEVIEELDVKVDMRDGVRLSTNIYRPDAEEAFPVILRRTPYGNDGTGNKNGHYWAKRGYTFVIQNTRGRFESEGIFYPLFYEASDGFDTQEWIGHQKWCNGKIGTVGASYTGYTQWISAPLQSKYLVTMAVLNSLANFYEGFYRQGAFRLRLWTWWGYMHTAPYTFDTTDILRKLDNTNFSLPIIDQDSIIGWRVPFIRDMLSHPSSDEYWGNMSIEGQHHNIQQPCLLAGGWFDLFFNETISLYIKMASRGNKSMTKLIVGPWFHSYNPDGVSGDLQFGKEAILDSDTWNEQCLRWFDYRLKGKDAGIAEEPLVKIFVMGDNVWRFENEWPLARTMFTRFYFHSEGHANTQSGDGFLSEQRPGQEPIDTYIYDPNSPAPSTADGLSFEFNAIYPKDHQRIEDREDVIVYSTLPLSQDIEVTGPIKVILHASSSAVNTDFTAKLCDVYPDGRSIRLCEGIIRATHRNGNKELSFIEQGKVYEYHIDLVATSNVFKKGHRIRVEISSSNFPRFDRNLNTSLNNALATEMVTATQTIYHDKDLPSCIVLPVIPR